MRDNAPYVDPWELVPEYARHLRERGEMDALERLQELVREAASGSTEDPNPPQ